MPFMNRKLFIVSLVCTSIVVVVLYFLVNGKLSSQKQASIPLTKTTPCDWLVEVKRTNTWLERDQAQRMVLGKLFLEASATNVKPDEQQVSILKAKIREESRILISELDDLVARCGWPTESGFGDKAPQYASLLVQHSELDVQLRYYPIMEAAAKAKELDFRFVAALDDRIRLFQKRPQLYGSQIVDDLENGGLKLWDVEDPAGLEERRSNAGMIPPNTCAYLNMFTPVPKYPPCEDTSKGSNSSSSKRAS